MGMHPNRGKCKVVQQALAFLRRDGFSQTAQMLWGNMVFTQVTQARDDQANDGVFRCDRFGRNMTKFDNVRPDFHSPGATIGEIVNLCRNLFAQAEQIGCKCVDLANTQVIPAGKCRNHRILGRDDFPEQGIHPRKIIQASGKSAKRALVREPSEGRIDGIAGVQVQKVAHTEHRVIRCTLHTPLNA